MQATQKAIARRLGISPSLVSRALNGQAERIGARASTIRRIRDEAARCGYAPNAAAVSLRSGSTRMLGVVVRDFADPFLGPLVGALQHLASAADYSLLVTGGAEEGGDADLQPLHKYRLDGFILVGSDFRPHGLDQAARSGAPVVRLGEGAPQDAGCQVCMGQAAGLARLLDYLAGLGHRAIGYVGGGGATNLRRETVLRRALAAAGLPVREGWFKRLPDLSAAALAQTARALTLGASRPSAIVAADDVTALALMRALHEQGAVVPRDVSVAGVDDIPFAHLAVPALTTLRTPVAALAACAFDLAVGRVAVAGQPRHEVQPELVVRESCAPPRKERT